MENTQGPSFKELTIPKYVPRQEAQAPANSAERYVSISLASSRPHPPSLHTAICSGESHGA